MAKGKNVLGTELTRCCQSPATGFHRNGYCESAQGDAGLHLVCAEMTADFLRQSKRRGNDLSTPVPEWGFPGLKPGDRWCLCVARWKEAFEAGYAPPVVLESTHISTLEFVTVEEMRPYAVK